MPHRPGVGAIFGIVSENGLAKDGSPVYLLDMRRDVGVGQAKIIVKQLTREDGGFSFTGLDPDYSDYAVLASDEDGVEPKNALIQDRVQPIPAHSGTGAMHEWHTRVMKDGAMVGIVTWPVGGSPTLQPLGLSGAVLYSGIESTPTEVVNIPSVPAMAGIRINSSGSLSTYGKNSGPFPNSASFELVLDLDSATSESTNLEIRFGAGCLDQNNRQAMSIASSFYSNYGAFFYRLQYDFVAKDLKLYIAGGYSGAESTNAPIVATFSLSSFSGLCHIIVSHVGGSDTTLYVNGSEVGSTPTQLSANYNNARWFGYPLTVGGTATGFAYGGDFLIGPVVAYSNGLSSQQALDHYKALFDNTIVPITSGYEKAMMSKYPSWYYRLDETDLTDGVFSAVSLRDPLTGVPDIFGVMNAQDNTALTPMQPSPILGKNSFSKASNNNISGSHAGILGFQFNDQSTFSCWAYFDRESISSNEEIVRLHGYLNSDPFIKVYRSTDGKIGADARTVIGVDSLSFNYTAPHSEWLNLWLVIDKTDSTATVARLYVGTETQEPVLVDSQPTSSTALYTMNNHRGSAYPRNGGSSAHIGSGMQGRLCEMALLPIAVGLEDIKEIWASRDVP